MKILKRGNDFVKVPDSSMADVIKIQTMTERGWEFAPKKEYKLHLNGGKAVEKTETTDEVKPKVEKVKKEKKVKESKKKK